MDVKTQFSFVNVALELFYFELKLLWYFSPLKTTFLLFILFNFLFIWDLNGFKNYCLYFITDGCNKIFLIFSYTKVFAFVH